MLESRPCKVSEIREGDEFRDEETGQLHWTALADAEPQERTSHVHLDVVFADGGRDLRVWDLPDIEIPIVREWPEEFVQL